MLSNYVAIPDVDHSEQAALYSFLQCLLQNRHAEDHHIQLSNGRFEMSGQMDRYISPEQSSSQGLELPSALCVSLSFD